MRTSVQFPREKFVSAARSSASSGTVKAKILSSSVCSSGFICTLDVMTDGQADARPPVLWNREPRLKTRPGHRWGTPGMPGLGLDISSGADLTRPMRACGALLPCAARCDIPPLKGRKSALPPKADMCSATRDVRFVSIADIREIACAKQKDRLAAVSPKSDQRLIIRLQQLASASCATPADLTRRGRWRTTARLQEVA